MFVSRNRTFSSSHYTHIPMQPRLMLLPLLAFVSHFAFADELTAAKRQDIQKLIEVTGATNFMKQAIPSISEQMFQVLKASRPDIPDRAAAVINKELTALVSERIQTPGGLIDLMI